jgi:hypothetical protein
LRDWQHASRLFTVDQFRLAPKQKFLFHVAFGINRAALTDVSLVQRYGTEINMLVKSIDLPSYQVKTETLNQYNRKKVVQYQQEPQEINVKFHDDNMGLINHLWQNYYEYYYADTQSATIGGAFNRTAMQNSNYIPTSYGLDNGSTAPFFTYIKIYQMARHEYVMYQLWNPMITHWNHNKLDYSQGNQTHEFDMKLKYEAVSYSVGKVTAGDPEGFDLEHYDNSLSPLQGINPDPTVFDPSFVQSLNVQNASASIINSVITQINTAQNTQQPLPTGITGIINTSTVQNTSGVAGVSFPQSPTLTNSTTATPVNV